MDYEWKIQEKIAGPFPILCWNRKFSYTRQGSLPRPPERKKGSLFSLKARLLVLHNRNTKNPYRCINATQSTDFTPSLQLPVAM